MIMFVYHNPPSPLQHPTIAPFAVPQFTVQWMLLFINIHLYPPNLASYKYSCFALNHAQWAIYSSLWDIISSSFNAKEFSRVIP